MANSIRIFKNLHNVLVTKAVLYYEIFIIGIKNIKLNFSLKYLTISPNAGGAHRYQCQ